MLLGPTALGMFQLERLRSEDVGITPALGGAFMSRSFIDQWSWTVFISLFDVCRQSRVKNLLAVKDLVTSNGVQGRGEKLVRCFGGQGGYHPFPVGKLGCWKSGSKIKF